jgi:molybdate transport system ATP-binding protein
LLFPHWNVRRNLESGARRAILRGHDFAATFREVVQVLELDPLLARSVDGLSGGERQRVALARALCSGPSLLTLDEPLASLDIQLRHRILPFLVRVRDTFRIPILVVSHNPVELQALCDEVIALRRGRIVAQGPPTDVFTRPEIYQTAATEGFENILPGSIVDQHTHTTVVQLGSPDHGPRVSVLKIERTGKGPVLLGIPAHDILVASERIRGISARNYLPATLQSIESTAHRQVLTAKLDDPSLPAVVIELTEDAMSELNLEKSKRIWLIVKSSSIAVYA